MSRTLLTDLLVIASSLIRCGLYKRTAAFILIAPEAFEPWGLALFQGSPIPGPELSVSTDVVLASFTFTRANVKLGAATESVHLSGCYIRVCNTHTCTFTVFQMYLFLFTIVLKDHCLYSKVRAPYGIFPPPPAYFTTIFFSHPVSQQRPSNQFQFTTWLRRRSRSG